MKIKARPNGPLLVETGGKCVHSYEGGEDTQEQELIALCRCGASAKKPFCDGSHKGVDFQAPAGELTIG